MRQGIQEADIALASRSGEVRHASHPAIEIANVSKKFKDNRNKEVIALQDVSLSINEHEFVSILGPSGCGKSTLLNIVAGFDTHTSGSVLLDGKPIKGPGLDRGVVFQEYSLFPWLTVEQNVAFGLRNKSMNASAKADITRDMINLVKLDGFRQAYPRELSGGMRQRVGIARALAIDPKILLMDEPFAALDALTRQELQEQLLEIWKRTRKTVLFITHSVEEAIYLSDRVVVMSRRPGRILQSLAIEEPRPRDVSGAEFNQFRRIVSETVANEMRRGRA